MPPTSGHQTTRQVGGSGLVSTPMSQDDLESERSGRLAALRRILGREPILWIGAGVSCQAVPPLPTLWGLVEGMRKPPLGWEDMPELEDPYE